jgi:hypothetical protein
MMALQKVNETFSNIHAGMADSKIWKLQDDFSKLNFFKTHIYRSHCLLPIEASVLAVPDGTRC